MLCYLRDFSEQECHGGLQFAHLVQRAWVKSRYRWGLGYLNGEWVKVTRTDRRSDFERYVSRTALIKDERSGVRGCVRHHAQLDQGVLRIPYRRLPVQFLEYVYEYGLTLGIHPSIERIEMDGKYGIITTEKKQLHEDEPVFLLRATDPLAALAVEDYATLCQNRGCTLEHVQQARDHASRIRQWQKENAGLTKELPD